MKLFAPTYYKKFKCIKDECSHSCCVGWEIDVDEKSAEKYSALNEGYGKVVRDSISYTECPHFELTEHDRCPHLNENGLCRIIIELGENMLCDICREHPRFYNVRNDCAEVGIGASCEEAARIILSSDDYDTLEFAGEYDSEACDEDADFVDPTEIRDGIYKILKKADVPYPDRLEEIYSLAGVRPSILTDTEWHRVISDLEYLDDESLLHFLSYSSNTRIGMCEHETLSRFLAYLVYRHTGAVTSEDELRRSLGFVLFTERLFASLIDKRSEPYEELCRLISEEIEYSEDNTESIRLEFL